MTPREGGPRSPGERVLVAVALLVVAALLVPVVHVVVFSFNDGSRSNVVWRGATTRHWTHPCGAPGVCEALRTSLVVAATAAAAATVLGTLMALALARSRFRGRSVVEALVLLPLATPEVVLGASLLTIVVQGFSRVGLGPGFRVLVASHVMLCLSYVVVIVRARLQSTDPRLEQAAADLHASPAATFRHVTLPLVAPGAGAGALLSFALSLDDVVVTRFVAGDTATFPTYVHAAALRGIPAEVDVIGTVLLVTVVGGVGAAPLLATGRRPGRSR